MFRLEDTICAISTSVSKNSAINIIRISGEKTFEILSKILKPPPPYIERKMYLGKIYEPDTKKLIDKIQWVYYKKPKSYTGEDMAEIFTHGGIIIPEIILKILIKLGARLAEPGEFTMRAVLNGKMDLLQAQAINQIVKSENLKALEISLKRLEGVLRKKFENLFEDIKEISAEIEVNLNYPEEDLPPFRKESIFKKIEKIEKKIKKYLEESENSKRVFEGFKISICGAPNVGKSTLFNKLIKKERAIVSEIPGTTRDYISENISIKGINSIIYDTAGLRLKTPSKIEKIGIKKTEKIIEESDIIIWIFDSQKKPLERELKKIKKLKKEKNFIFVINKMDKKIKWNKNILKDLGDEVFEISALKGIGLENLVKEIEKRFEKESGSAEISLTLYEESKLKEILYEIEKSKETLKEGREEITGLHLKNALSNLNTLLGKDIDNEILQKIFSDFCVGK
ncbi:MAG: tRNA uridine-5-carboxymethylaminomethyl(34) synthesis GTPase MnmE [candidate division WOR-3 bacterium]